MNKKRKKDQLERMIEKALQNPLIAAIVILFLFFGALVLLGILINLR